MWKFNIYLCSKMNLSTNFAKKKWSVCWQYLLPFGDSLIQAKNCVRQFWEEPGFERKHLKTVPMSLSTVVYLLIRKTKIFMCLLSCNCRWFMYYSIDTMFTYSFVKHIYYLWSENTKNIVDQTSKYCFVNNYTFRLH